MKVRLVKALPLMKEEWSASREPARYRSAGCEQEFISSSRKR